MKTLLRIKVILRIWAGVCLFIVCPPSAGSVFHKFFNGGRIVWVSVKYLKSSRHFVSLV